MKSKDSVELKQNRTKIFLLYFPPAVDVRRYPENRASLHITVTSEDKHTSKECPPPCHSCPHPLALGAGEAA